MGKNMLMQLDWEQPPVHSARQVLPLAHLFGTTLTQLEATRQILQSEAQALGVTLKEEIASSGHPVDTLLALGN